MDGAGQAGVRVVRQVRVTLREGDAPRPARLLRARPVFGPRRRRGHRLPEATRRARNGLDVAGTNVPLEGDFLVGTCSSEPRLFCPTGPAPGIWAWASGGQPGHREEGVGGLPPFTSFWAGEAPGQVVGRECRELRRAAICRWSAAAAAGLWRTAYAEAPSGPELSFALDGLRVAAENGGALVRMRLEGLLRAERVKSLGAADNR